MVIARARVALPAAIAVVLLGVAGCGSGSSGGSGLPTVTGPTGPATTATTATASSTAAPSPDPSPWTALPTISSGPNQGVHQGTMLASSVASTPDERAAVDAFVAYWDYLGVVGYQLRVDKAALRRRATGSAETDAEAYVAALTKDNARTVGWISMHVTSITTRDNSAIVAACIDNGSFDVDRVTGRAREAVPVGFDAEGALSREGSAWRVSFSRSNDRKKPCPEGELR